MAQFTLSEDEYAEACVKKAEYEARMRYRQFGAPPPDRPAKKTTIYTREQAAEALGISQSYLRKLEDRGWITKERRKDRKVFFTEAEVERCRRRRAQ